MLHVSFINIFKIYIDLLLIFMRGANNSALAFLIFKKMLDLMLKKRSCPFN